MWQSVVQEREEKGSENYFIASICLASKNLRDNGFVIDKS